MHSRHSDGFIRKSRKPVPQDDPKKLNFKFTPSSLANAASAKTKNAPPAIVKVISFQHDKKGVLSLINYLTKDGEIDIKDGQGLVYDTKQEFKDIADYWNQDVDTVKPNRQSVLTSHDFRPRLSMHMMLSLPYGHDEQTMEKIAKEFAKIEFGDNYDYVYALHNDDNRPHVHFAINVHGFDGYKLNPRKKDLEHYRGRFSELAKQYDINLRSVPNYVYGKDTHVIRQGEYYLRKKGVELDKDKADYDAIAKALKKGYSDIVADKFIAQHKKAIDPIIKRHSESERVDQFLQYQHKELTQLVKSNYTKKQADDYLANQHASMQELIKDGYTNKKVQDFFTRQQVQTKKALERGFNDSTKDTYLRSQHKRMRDSYIALGDSLIKKGIHSKNEDLSQIGRDLQEYGRSLSATHSPQRKLLNKVKQRIDSYDQKQAHDKDIKY